MAVGHAFTLMCEREVTRGAIPSRYWTCSTLDGRGSRASNLWNASMQRVWFSNSCVRIRDIFPAQGRV